VVEVGYGCVVDDAAEPHRLDHHGCGACVQVGADESTSLRFSQGRRPAIGEGFLHCSDSLSISVCETQITPPNCVTFAEGTTPGTTKTLTLSAAGTLTVGQTDGWRGATILFDTNVAGSDIFGATFLAIAPPAPVTTGTFSNEDTIYLVTYTGG
jgi:hypothetical protein